MTVRRHVFAVIVVFLLKGSKATSHNGMVVTNGPECAKIGGSMLDKGGSAVDAAIAALLCEGVVLPQAMGLGGGFLMTIYIRETKQAIVLNARETAPAAASESMYGGNATLSAKGALSIAIPGQLRGMWDAHQRYGRLPWADLFRPVITLCEQGHVVTPFLEAVFRSEYELIMNSPTLKRVFIYGRNKIYRTGQKLRYPRLALALREIARFGVGAFYNGGIVGKTMIQDIRSLGGIMTLKDLRDYRVIWSKPISASLTDELTLHTVPPPGSGVVLTFILNILNGFLDLDKRDSAINWHRIVESLKHGYGRRTELGDLLFVPEVEALIAKLTSPDFANEVRDSIKDDSTSQNPEDYGGKAVLIEDHGTAHLSILAPNGDAVSVTSTINTNFGSGIVSRAGIILNNEMDDFSSPNIVNSYGVPPSPSNYIRPSKRPMSSMSPSIITDSVGNVRLIIGGAGGTRITSSVAISIIRHLFFKMSIGDILKEKRLHHQLYPMELSVENGFYPVIKEELRSIGHVITETDLSHGFSAVVGISVHPAQISGAVSQIVGAFDPRRGGAVYESVNTV